MSNVAEFKQLFMKEIETINDLNLKKALNRAAKDAPSYFWEVAASSSGKFHPQCSLGECGLVRHSLLVVKIGLDLLSAEIYVKNTETNRDLLIASALFHDIKKQGDGSGTSTVFDHPNQSESFLRHYLEEAEVLSEHVETICNSIKAHMGKWNKANYAPGIYLKKPKTDFDKLLHTADYIASRKYIQGLEEWSDLY